MESNDKKSAVRKAVGVFFPSLFAGILTGTIVGKYMSHVDPPSIEQLPPKYYGIQRSIKRTIRTALKKYKTMKTLAVFSATVGSTLLMNAVANLDNYSESTENKIALGGFLLGIATALFLMSRSPLDRVMSSEAMLLAELL